MLNDRFILAALDIQNNIAIVLMPTEKERQPIIAETSDALLRLTGLPRERVDGQELTILSEQSSLSPEWCRLLDAITAGDPLRGEVPCHTTSSEMFWFGYTLTHIPDQESGRHYPVLTGRDITVDRWRMQEQSTTDVLLSLAFMKVDTPVALTREDGRIITVNSAMLSLTGYKAADLDGTHIRELTHSDDVVPISAAHARLCAEGEGCQMRLMTCATDGRVIPVWLTTGWLEDPTLGRIHVLTMVPESARTAAVGRVETVNLQAVRDACGEAWDRMSGRLLIMAESVLKQRLGPHDVFARSVEADLMIWFHSGNKTDDAASIATITREVRIRLLGELGEHALLAAADATASEAREPPATAASCVEPVAAEPLTVAELRELQATIHSRALEVVAKLSVDTAVEVTRIMDRDERLAGLVWADLPRATRARLDLALGTLHEDALIEAGLAYPELLHLRIAVAGIKRDLVEGQRRAWLLPISCAALLSRKRRKWLLEALRNLQLPFQMRLRGLLADIPTGLPEVSLRDWFDQLKPLLHGVGVLARAPELPLMSSLRAPCDLVAVDLWSGQAPAYEAAAKLLGTTRRLGLPVLVRTAQRAEARQWRDFGATLFAITKPDPMP